MKIRTDFVTNSSSSSFTLLISFKLTDGKCVKFKGEGGTGETGRLDYFNNDALVKVSPRELGFAKDVDDLINLLTNGILDYDDFEEESYKIFSESNPREPDTYDEFASSRKKVFDAFDFIKKIREKIKSVDDIETITITGNEVPVYGDSYCRSYSYNRKTKKYTGSQTGEEIQPDGTSGGDFDLSDLDKCKITYKDK